MSSSAALKTEPVKAKRAASRASEAAPSQQPKLSVVAGIAPAQRRHLGVIMLVILGLVIAIGGPLLISARTTFEAIETSRLTQELEVARDHTTTLRQELEKAESPVVIEQRARSLGMVPAGSSGVVQLDKGLVSGGSTSDSAK